MKISVGADPEIFLFHSAKQEYRSAHDIIPGDKKNPYKVKCGAVQVDGTAAEFNIDPAFSSEEFVHNLDTVLGELRKMVPKYLEFKYVPSVKYPKRYFDRIPDDSKVLGCDPDYDGHTGVINPRPDAVGTLRAGGGHIHVGWTKDKDPHEKDHFWDCQQVVKQVCNLLYYPMLQWDTDQDRRKLYGKAYAFRPKSYGCEVREFSNAWLNQREHWPWMFNSIQKVMDTVEKGRSSFYTRYDDYYNYKYMATQAGVMDIPGGPPKNRGGSIIYRGVW